MVNVVKTFGLANLSNGDNVAVALLVEIENADIPTATITNESVLQAYNASPLSYPEVLQDPAFVAAAGQVISGRIRAIKSAYSQEVWDQVSQADLDDDEEGNEWLA